MPKANIIGKTFTLQSLVKPDDADWSYHVPSLPKGETANAAGLIKAIAVVSDKSKQFINLTFSTYSPNRAVDAGELDSFVSISFEHFRLQYPAASSENGEPAKEGQPAPARESAEYVVRLLRRGIVLNGVQYHFYGHSNSQLKTKSCFLYAGRKEDVSRKVEALGDFSRLTSVAKKAKRIGLLFSSAKMALKLAQDRCQDIPDFIQNDYIFTDGCGLISKHLAKLLVQRVDIRFRNQRYTPSVFQIRYRGYKGILTLEPRLQGQILAQFRDSMKKFKGSDDLSFSVVEYSKPYSFGVLNDEIILLLSALGVSEDVFLRKQNDYLHFLSRASSDPRCAFRFLCYMNRLDLAERVLIDGVELVRSSIQKFVNGEIAKTLNKRDEQRCRIFIPQSRLLFGVCDSRGILKEGECAIRITMDGDGVARTIVGTEVLVTRNPCLHPGDVRKFKAVQHHELSHLVDCIVFSTTGRRPSADLMSGGDLDGDKFFVCWDPDIVPPKLAEAAHYQGGKEPVNFKPITDDDRLVYFARYTNASLGRVKNLYMDWARLRGPMSSQCQELNHLFSRCVDGNRIKVPQHLENPPKVHQPALGFILDILHSAAEDFIRSYQNSPAITNNLTDDTLELLLCRDEVSMSEFDLFKMTAKWCIKNDASLLDFLLYFDFTQMTDIEKAWVLNQIPMGCRAPSLVLNDLTRSNLISEAELCQFRLNLAGMRWKCLFDSSRDRLGRLFEVVGLAMERFHRKILVLRVDTRLTIIIFIPQKIKKYTESLVDNTVRLFAFPHSQGNETMHRRAVPTKMDYRLYFDDTGFQLYEKQRSNTWIFLTKPGVDDSTYRNVEDRGDRRRSKEATMEIGLNHDCIASFALNKFSSGLAKHVGRVNRDPVIAAEIYVITNRDIRALQVVDKWLDFIDTGEVLPLFENEAREYNLPSIAEVDWTAEPQHIRQIAKETNLSWFNLQHSGDEYRSVFEWLLCKDQKALLRRIYSNILTVKGSSVQGKLNPTALRTMISFLDRAPFLAVTLVDVGPWDSLPASLSSVLVENSAKLLEAFVFNANKMESLVIEPFKYLLAQIPHVSKPSFSGLVETISLVVSEPEIALDLLVGALEPNSSRVLTGRPLVVRYFVNNLIGIAIEHIDEANESQTVRRDLLDLFHDRKTGLIGSQLRVDATSLPRLAAKDHVRLIAASLPKNSLLVTPYAMDALVEKVESGRVLFRCLHPVPLFLEDCSWKLIHCGSFVTSQTMFEALTRFIEGTELSHNICESLLCAPGIPFEKVSDLGKVHSELNQCQSQAVNIALKSNLTCLWGPPGTGKTHTIVIMIEELLAANSEYRMLVTAPTHNAVDNAMRKFLTSRRSKARRIGDGDLAIRVSTDFRKVADDLRDYTCDAMLGKEINEHPEARKQAQKRIKNCRLVFTTCIGAGLGLLREELFDVVIIDEASQQTEPASLVPLVKGCSKAILVGDHVQLRATTQQHASALDFDVSMFERLYTSPDAKAEKVMLDTQYRMHADLCRFSSQEFYDERLQTAVTASTRPLGASKFVWPKKQNDEHARLVFVQCSATEDLGRKSKANSGQAEVARDICAQLLTPIDQSAAFIESSIAVLTPYSRQAEILRKMLPQQVVVNSIDGFQGREADIVLFVTVRCNVAGEIGFLKDKRRLNVVMTRAKAACIIIGDQRTLTAGNEADESTGLWKRLITTAMEVQGEKKSSDDKNAK